MNTESDAHAPRSRKRNASLGSTPRIFVQIPAYRDSELVSTLSDLYAKAQSPELLRVAVLWQRVAGESLPRYVRSLPNLEVVEVAHTESRGCNWARSALQDLWQGERFTVLLDSHHRFVRNWDAIAIQMHEAMAARGVRRPLLTAYLPPYEPTTDPRGRKRTPFKIYPLQREDRMLLRLTSYPMPFWRSLNGPIPADFISLHFLFTDGEFNRDVRFDPRSYFVGDEISISVRAFTCGFDFFHPHIVLGWHCYDRSSRVTHWDDHPEWRQQNALSLARLRRLYRGQLTGKYGIGTDRSVADYERHLQIDLEEQ